MKQEERVLSEWDVYEMAEATALNLSRKGVLKYIVRKKDVMDELEPLIRAVEAKVGKMLTCSERQEEQKPIFKKGDRVIWDGEEFNILNVDKDFYNVGGYIVPFSREGELHPIGQKPAEWDFPYGVNETVDKLIAIAECLEMDGDCLFNGYTGAACGKFLRDLARKQVECKPTEWNKATINGEPIYTENQSVDIPLAEWSEEDEAIRQSIIKDIEFERNYTSATTDKADKVIEKYNGQIAWLKFLDLKKRNEDIAKLCSNEWNEEDEELAEELIKLAEYYTDTEGTTEFKPHISWLKDLKERFNSLPKQEWSEKDKQILNAAIDMVEKGNVFFTFENNKWKVSDWLKLLPGRFGLQPKQEWDEFDEDCLKRAIWYIENAPSAVKDTNLALWLKLLPKRFGLQPKQERSETGEENKGEMVSPFTGGKVVEEEALTEVEYRGAKYSVPRKYYKCVDTGRQFSTSEQDGDLMWAVFRKYCEERNFDTFRDLLPEGKFSNTAVTNLLDVYNTNRGRLRFPHLEIYHSGVMDWCVRIYEQDGIGSGSKENVIVDVQHCDPLYAFAKAESTLKEWLLKNKDGY